ncbi:serine protease [Streptomyces sp. NBC_00210]|uniref:VMAP-C domain-containing protein n=1 Tax=unclassified Streptomyces TaxID=2593676 RepID=UPI0032516F7B
MQWRARIGATDGRPLGAGLLVDATRLITCAHVVQGLAKVSVTFPGVIDSLPASVAWSGDWQRLGDRGDIAVLELEAPLSVPACPFAPLDMLRPRDGRATYELRALGFPFGHEDVGTHVTLHTSQDRLQGEEWLEMDVAQAHLQRLDEGFSGAAVYDPVTGLVVGLVADAVLGGEQQGYLGRMLPLDTIRRHWEELDDLLELDWLPSRPRRELRRVFEHVQVDEGRAKLAVKRAFPTFIRPLPPFGSVWAAIRFVGEEMTGEDRLLRLLREIRASVPSRIGARIDTWVRRWVPQEAADWGEPLARPGPPTGSVMVRLDPMTRGASLELTVCTVVDGTQIGQTGPVRVRRDQVRTKVETHLAEQMRNVHDFEWMLEFVVPEGLMNEPFEEWHIHEPGAPRPRPMRSVPVVIRHMDRLKPLTVSRLTRKRWSTLRTRGETRPEQVGCGLPYGYQEFYDWIEDDDDLCAFAYAASPRADWLSAALDTGIPIMLWRRHDCGGVHTHCEPEDFLDRLTATVGSIAADQLPFEVMKLRKEARSPQAGHPNHCGLRLTLFWDDPERRPDPPLAMGSA